eukprot:5391006-Karenia_brevis.AAC.1
MHDLWNEGALMKPLAKIKIDEKNCFGMLSWPAIRKASQEQLPKHAAAVCWKHRDRSLVEQPGVDDVLKDRGAEQGDVDGPLEAGLAIGCAARASRLNIHRQQRQGLLQWCGEVVEAATQDFDDRQRRQSAWLEMSPEARQTASQSGGPLTRPTDEIQCAGGLADFWYLDDGDVWCDPALAVPYLRAFDSANLEIGGERNLQKTVVVMYATEEQMKEHAEEWQLDSLSSL